MADARDKILAKMARNQAYWAKRIEAEQARAEALAGRASAHMRQLEQKLFRELQGQLRDLLGNMENGKSLTASDYHNYKKYLAIMDDIKTKIPALADRENSIIETELKQVFDATYNGRWYKSATGGNPSPTDYVVSAQQASQAVPGASPISFNVVSDEVRNNVINANWSGRTFKTIGTRNGDKFADRLQTLMENTLLTGQTDTVMQELQDVFGMHFHEADRLLRTESAHVYNESALERYEKVGIGKVKVLNFESTACEACQLIVDDAPEGDGIYNIDDTNKPTLPVHPNCRCAFAPYFDDD